MELVLANSGHSVQLGDIIGRGGEGTIYELQGRDAEAAKIYLQLPPREKVAKLQAMAQVPDAALLKIAAWPVGQ